MIVEHPTILVVDDDECATLLVTTVFARAGLQQPLQFAANGIEAIAYLQGEGAFADRTKHPFPCFMLLDLNMPRMNGFEVLAWLRDQRVYKQLPVHVLSASSQDEDIRRCYELGARSYLVKPANLDGLMHQANCLLAWHRLCHRASPG